MSAEVRFPTRTIALVLVVSACLIGWLIWTGENIGGKLTGANERATAGAQVLGEMARLDEALTGSARLAAATGEPKWKARYDDLTPKFDKTLERAQALASPALRDQYKTTTDAANATLLKLEEAAFAAATPAEAQAILDSDAYTQAKQINLAGSESFAKGLEAETAAIVDAARAAQHRSLIFTLVGSAVMAGGWFVLIRTLLTCRLNLDQAQREH